MMELANVPPGFVPIFNFQNSLSRSITLALELSPLEIVLAPGDFVHVFVYEDDATLPMTIELSDECLQIHPHRAWGNWYAYKNGEDVSGEPYRNPI